MGRYTPDSSPTFGRAKRSTFTEARFRLVSCFLVSDQAPRRIALDLGQRHIELPVPARPDADQLDPDARPPALDLIRQAPALGHGQ